MFQYQELERHKFSRKNFQEGKQDEPREVIFSNRLFKKMYLIVRIKVKDLPIIYTIIVEKYQRYNGTKAPHLYKLLVESTSAEMNEHNMGVLKKEKDGMR